MIGLYDLKGFCDYWIEHPAMDECDQSHLKVIRTILDNLGKKPTNILNMKISEIIHICTENADCLLCPIGNACSRYFKGNPEQWLAYTQEVLTDKVAVDYADYKSSDSRNS